MAAENEASKVRQFKIDATRHSINLLSGGLAQLARAPALQAGGQGFDSLILHTVHTNQRSLTY